MTTLLNVTLELEKNNFPTTGAYSSIPQSTYHLIISILHFGESQLEKSTLGKGIKLLALDLAKKDGRKPVICKNTLKTILK